jgi:lipopolysaccharide export system permease protein
MIKLENYLLKNFSNIFFSIFMTLFTVVSIIILIKISSKSAVLYMNFSELLLMYSYFLPTILYFTIPIVFFASITIALSKLSLDSELISILALGVSPAQIMKIVLKLGIFFSITLFVLSFGLRPITEQLMDNFIEEKKANASINLNSNEFGQKFGDWSVIVDKKEDTKITDIILYNRVENHLIKAKKAYTENIDFKVNLVLENGIFYKLDDDTFKQAIFEKMVFKNITKNNISNYSNIINYWTKIDNNKKRLKEFVLAFLVSLMPILFIYLIVLIGIINPRNRNNYTSLQILLSILSYVIPIFILLPKLGVYTIPTIIILWIGVTYYLYKNRIKIRY